VSEGGKRWVMGENRGHIWIQEVILHKN